MEGTGWHRAFLTGRLAHAAQLPGKEVGGFHCLECQRELVDTPCLTCMGTEKCPECNAFGKEASFDCKFCGASGFCPVCQPGRKAEEEQEDEGDDIICAETEPSAKLGASKPKLTKAPSFRLSAQQTLALGKIMEAVVNRAVLREDVAEILAEDISRGMVEKAEPEALAEVPPASKPEIAAAVEVVRTLVVEEALQVCA